MNRSKLVLNVTLFLFSYGLLGTIISTIIIVDSKGHLNNIEEATVVSTQNIIDSCINKCKYGDVTYKSDPYACYKSSVTFLITSTQENCVYVDPLSSTNNTMMSVYAKDKYPIGSLHNVYDTDGNTNGVKNCNYASQSYMNDQESTKAMIYNSFMVLYSTLVSLFNSFIVLYILIKYPECCTRPETPRNNDSDDYV